MVIDLMVPRKYLAWQMVPGVETLAILAVKVGTKKYFWTKIAFPEMSSLGVFPLLLLLDPQIVLALTT